MRRPLLTLMLVSSMVSSSLSAGDKPTLTLVTSHTAVSPRESVELKCELPNPSNISVEFNLYRNGKLEQTKRAENSTSFSWTATSDQSSKFDCSFERSSQNMSPKSNTVNITMVKLIQPNINFSASGDWFHWWLQELEVTRGYKFSIICSTQPEFEGGSFYLRISGESSINRTQLTDKYSAIFSFPEADYVHQGKYSCVYAVTVSSRDFKSPSSEPMDVIVKESLVPYISVPVGVLFVSVPIIIFFIKKKQKKNKHSYRVRTSGENKNTEIEEDDYENAVMALQQREDSDASSADYINTDAVMKKTEVGYNNKCAGDKNTNMTACQWKEMEDGDEDYENFVTADPEEEGSDDSNEDYVNVDADVKKTAAQNHWADAKHTQVSAQMENEMDDEDDYENPEDTIQEKEDLEESDEDYINFN